MVGMVFSEKTFEKWQTMFENIKKNNIISYYLDCYSIDNQLNEKIIQKNFQE